MLRLSILFFALANIFSCSSNVIESHQSQPINPWRYPDNVTADFELSQNEIGQPLGLELLIKHHDDFPYENLYLKYWVISGVDTIKEEILSIQLQDDLGQWNGHASGNIYEYRFFLENSLNIEDPSLQIKIVQYSRMNKLPGIKNIEIRLIRT